MSVIITDEERARWTVNDAAKAISEEVLCECIATGKSEKMITPNGSSKPVLVCSFVLKLVEVNTGEEVTRYLKFTKSKSGHATVKPNSKFAMLYRLTIGDNPRKRYSQAQYLVNHFLGKQFIVTYVIEKTSQNETYRKATSIKPVDLIVADGWTNTGQLRNKYTPRKRSEILGKVFDEPLKILGKVVESSLTGKAEEPQFNLASPSISNVSKSLHARGQVCIKAGSSSNVIDEEHTDGDSIINTATISNAPKVYREVF